MRVMHRLPEIPGLYASTGWSTFLAVTAATDPQAHTGRAASRSPTGDNHPPSPHLIHAPAVCRWRRRHQNYAPRHLIQDRPRDTTKHNCRAGSINRLAPQIKALYHIGGEWDVDLHRHQA